MKLEISDEEKYTQMISTRHERKEATTDLTDE